MQMEQNGMEMAHVVDQKQLKAHLAMNTKELTQNNNNNDNDE